MTPDSTEPLKKLPSMSAGVRQNSAMRMVKLAQPICPNSQPLYTKDANGKRVQAERGPDQTNCQRAGGRWWVECEEKGHDPYFSNQVWYTTEDIWNEETGVLEGTRRIRHGGRTPNVAQVALARRINNGKGVEVSMEKKGFLRLSNEKIGYEEVCQFRNCMKPTSPKYHSIAFGNYCSREHLELIAADASGVLVKQIGGFEGPSIEQIRQERAAQLRQAAAFSTSGEGATR